MRRNLRIAAVVLAISGCASTTAASSPALPPAALGDAAIDELIDDGSDRSPESSSTPTSPAEPRDVPPAGPATPSPPSTFAQAITPLGSAEGALAQADVDQPAPVSMDLPSLGVEGAPVTSVGVEANGEMQIPGATAVGWYRYGPRPGATGSAVLAAHIAFDGRDGVFRDLTDLEPGDEFSVGFDDGTSREFVVLGLRQYGKDEIPLDKLFSRDGTPRLALITCGGSFNSSLRSYDDNVVAIAVPLDLGQGEPAGGAAQPTG